MLWVDKYRPTSLDTLDFHESLSDQLVKLCQIEGFPHLLVYGPSAGKKTRVQGILRELYGPGVEKLKIDQKSFTTPSGKKLDLNLISSNYHIEITPIVVQELIKEIASTSQVDKTSQKQFKVVVFNEADSLSKDAQHALRRTMEKYMKNMRVIMVCNSTSRIISPIRSRCFLVRVSSPTVEEIKTILLKIGKKEKLVCDDMVERISISCQGNLRRAILCFETAKNLQYPFTLDQPIPKPDWECFVQEMCIGIVKEQSPASLINARTKCYELLSHCIPPERILSSMMNELLLLIDQEMKPQIIDITGEYEHRLRLGQKSIFHLEAFIAKFMSLYKKYLLDLEI